MQTELISVIVPVYNVRRYLKQCVKSICSQTYREMEIILVDDGSDDGSGEMCDALSQQDSRIVVIHKTNGGLSDARNAGLAVAAGNYIGYVDSDDRIKQTMFQILYDNLKRYDADISCCRYEELYDDGAILPIGNTHQIRIYEGTDGLKEFLLGKVIDPFVWNKLYKARYTYPGGTDTSPVRFIKGIIGEDIPFNLEIFKQRPRVVLAGESLYGYRQARLGSICASALSQKRIDSTLRWETYCWDIRTHYPELEIYALRRQALFYIGLYNRIIRRDNGEEYQEIKIHIRQFIKQNLGRFVHSNICGPSLKIASFLLAEAPFLYSHIMKMYKRFHGTARL